MTENQLTQWLQNQKDPLDNIIAAAGRRFYQAHSLRSNFAYELDECQKESFNLVSQKDLCYDRKLTPFVYSLWYHGRRVNTFLAFLCKAFFANTSSKIEIFDLGAGTGAVQFSVALITEGMRNFGVRPPEIKVINVDSSPFMLNYNKEYLWPEFLQHYPSAKSLQIEYCVNSWNTQLDQQSTNPWLTASYLFDISDQKELVAQDFIKTVKQYRPRKILLLGSGQGQKIALLKDVSQKIEQAEKYVSKLLSIESLPLDGSLRTCNELRIELSKRHDAFSIGRETTWNDGSFHGVYLDRIDSELDMNLKPLVNEPMSIQLYNTKLKFRKDLKLSDQQKKAANFFGRQSVIIGPAGSGKSIVITEKIKTLIDDKWNYNPKFKALLTTFNKALIKKVGDWLEEMLDHRRAKRVFYRNSYGNIEASYFTFDNENQNVILMNFDLLPPRLGGLKANVQKEDSHHLIFEQVKAELRREKTLSESDTNFLTPEFLFEEYHKIFYGLNLSNEEAYINAPRSGMWSRLGKNQRQLVYKVILKYSKQLQERGIDSFITLRRKLHRNLSAGGLTIKFDHIFIDEFQDCTKTDFEIFLKMSKDVNNITFAGDLAQSIHLGKAAKIPRDESTRRRENFYLDGSYRVPHRISECLHNLSTEIVKRFKDNTSVMAITPVKNSPPGARPIVVYSHSIDDLAYKINEIWNDYAVFNLSKITILETDTELSKTLKSLGLAVETDTILKLKGLEKDCIVWSTRKPIEDEREVYEFAYTIMTRTSNILIIALFDLVQDHFKRVFGLLREDRLIFYDQISKQQFLEWREMRETEVPQELADSNNII